MMKRTFVALYALSVLAIAVPGTASADDYDTCTYDAGRAYEDCLRSAQENHFSDAVCVAQRDAALRRCRELYGNN